MFGVKMLKAASAQTLVMPMVRSWFRSPIFFQFKRGMFGVNVGLPGRPKAQTPVPTGSAPPKKPVMRELLITQLKWQALGAFIFVIIMALNWRISVVQCRKKHYKAYYRCYDEVADYERMKRAGVFQSLNPDGSCNTIS